jgi:hypothetical protein
MLCCASRDAKHISFLLSFRFPCGGAAMHRLPGFSREKPGGVYDPAGQGLWFESTCFVFFVFWAEVGKLCRKYGKCRK